MSAVTFVVLYAALYVSAVIFMAVYSVLYVARLQRRQRAYRREHDLRMRAGSPYRQRRQPDLRMSAYMRKYQPPR